jgi:hypothetical protein
LKISYLIRFSLFIIYFLSFDICYSQATSEILYDAGSSIDIQVTADVCATNIIINGTFSGGGTICSGALPVTISSFEARVTKNNVRLIWVTEIETNNSGFDIERKKVTTAGNGEWKKIGFIPGSGTTNSSRIYTYEDLKLPAVTYKYRLKQIDYNGYFEYFDLSNDVIIGKPKEFLVSQNYPNPSNPKSKIDFQLPFDGKVTLKVYDLLGREVVTLIDGNMAADFYTVEFNGSNLASGVYFYRMDITETSTLRKDGKTMKMVLVK